MDAISTEERKALIKSDLRKVLNSKHFRNAPVVRSFLEFVVNESVAGRGDRIKAYTIAFDVFNRDSQFDPSSDTIVRTTAGRVRKALRAYYLECEKDSRVIISLPNRGYAPSFEFREAPSPQHPNSPGHLPSIRRSHFRLGMLLAACICAVVIIGTAVLFWWNTGHEALPNNVVINVQSAGYVDEKTQSLAREIDIRLAPALSRLRVAQISPAYSATAAENSVNDIIFTLKTTVTNDKVPKLLWQLIDAKSGYLLWSSSEPLSKMDFTSIDVAVDKLSFRVLGRGGAVPFILAKYHGQVFSGQACLSRAQVMELINDEIIYPEIRDCLERIVTRSPNDASAWAVLSTSYTLRSYFYSAGNLKEREALVQQAEYAAQKATELAPESYLTKVALMDLAFRQGKVAEFDSLQQEIRHSYPGDIYLQIRIATRFTRLGRSQEALEIFDKAQKDFGINLKNWSPAIAVAYFAEGEYIPAYRQILRATSDLRFVLVLKAAILGKLEMTDEAESIIDELVAINPDIKETFYPWLTDIGWAEPLVHEVADGLAKAGLVVNINATDIP